MTDISIFVAFSAGFISFISPCVLPLIPAYISFISGVSIDVLKDKDSRLKNIKNIMVNSALFVLGFSAVFILMGASATIIGSFLIAKLSILSKIAGGMIILLGLHFSGIFRIKYLNYEKRFNIHSSKLGLLGIFVAGLAFAFGWTPCIGPILASILTLAATKKTVSDGVLLLSAYSLGLGIPFFITGIAVNTFLNLFSKIKRYYKIIEIISGLFLVIIGVMIMFNYFSIISGYLIKWFPFLQSIG
ncbi:cytochrome C biogenesis protein [bacterium SM23_31]|nr:MAG: cytochrome C biogenesis protein [bacterium SM23_31]